MKSTVESRRLLHGADFLAETAGKLYELGLKDEACFVDGLSRAADMAAANAMEEP